MSVFGKKKFTGDYLSIWNKKTVLSDAHCAMECSRIRDLNLTYVNIHDTPFIGPAVIIAYIIDITIMQ